MYILLFFCCICITIFGEIKLCVCLSLTTIRWQNTNYIEQRHRISVRPWNRRLWAWECLQAVKSSFLVDRIREQDMSGPFGSNLLLTKHTIALIYYRNSNTHRTNYNSVTGDMESQRMQTTCRISHILAWPYNKYLLSVIHTTTKCSCGSFNSGNGNLCWKG